MASSENALVSFYYLDLYLFGNLFSTLDDKIYANPEPMTMEQMKKDYDKHENQLS